MSAAKGNPRDSGYERNAHDWYVEPPWAVHDLLDAEQFDGPIWDPACGRGTIPIVASRRGYAAFGSDLVDRGFGVTGRNFLGLASGPAPNIICNPPFGAMDAWLRHCLRLTTGKVAIFGKLTLLAGKERGAWYPTTPLARIWVHSERVPCPPGEVAPPIDAWGRDTITGTWVDYAWLVWSRGYVGEPLIGWLPRVAPPSVQQLELLGP